MKIAFASSNGKVVNRPFAMADRFFVWDVSPDRASCVARIQSTVEGDDQERKSLERVMALRECVLVCSIHVAGQDARHLKARRIQFMNAPKGVVITEVVRNLQGLLRAGSSRSGARMRNEEELG